MSHYLFLCVVAILSLAVVPVICTGHPESIRSMAVPNPGPVALYPKTSKTVEDSGNNWNWDLEKYFDGDSYENKQDTPSTFQTVNIVFRVLGPLAMFTIFILQPIFYSILSAATGDPIAYLSKRMRKNSGPTNLFVDSSQKTAHPYHPFDYYIYNDTARSLSTVRGILDRDRCIERISCEIANYTRRRSYIRHFAERISSLFSTSAEYGIKRRILTTFAKKADVCPNYPCDPVGFLLRLFIYKIDWNTILKV